MKFTCLQENLNRGLGIVGRAVASRTTLPITNNILLVTDRSRLKLAATNLEIAITCWIGAMVEEEGSITIPARLLTDFVGSLPNENIDMNLSSETNTMELTCARFNGRINGVDAAEFPPIPSVGEGVTTRIDPEALRLAIAQVVFSAATDEMRPVLTGVYSAFDGNTLTLAAADGFRLSVHKAPLSEPVAERIEVIIPARALNELQRLITDQEEPVELTINPNRSQVLFRLKDVEMISQLLEGTFPNYNQLIPEGYTSRAEVSLAEFARAARPAAIFAREGSAIVRLQVTPGDEQTPGKIVLSARTEEIGDNIGEVDAVMEGEEAKIAFSSKYLSDVLGVLHEERVVMEVTTPSSPGVFRPVGVDNYTHVIMPVFVQW